MTHTAAEAAYRAVFHSLRQHSGTKHSLREGSRPCDKSPPRHRDIKEQSNLSQRGSLSCKTNPNLIMTLNDTLGSLESLVRTRVRGRDGQCQLSESLEVHGNSMGLGQGFKATTRRIVRATSTTTLAESREKTSLRSYCSSEWQHDRSMAILIDSEPSTSITRTSCLLRTR